MPALSKFLSSEFAMFRENVREAQSFCFVLLCFAFPYLNPGKYSNNNSAASLLQHLFSNASAMQRCLSCAGRRKQAQCHHSWPFQALKSLGNLEYISFLAPKQWTGVAPNRTRYHITTGNTQLQQNSQSDEKCISPKAAEPLKECKKSTIITWT